MADSGIPIDVESAEATEVVEESKSRLRKPLMLLVPLLVVVASVYFYLSGGRFEDTDNAALQTGQLMVSASASGRVTAIAVQENQFVKQGQELFRIEADNQRADLAEAEAQLAAARADVAVKRADLGASQAAIRAAQARLAFARGEAARQSSLVREGISSRAQYDAAVLAVRTAEDEVSASQARSGSVLAALAGSAAGPVDSLPGVRKAEAGLAQSRIALGYTVIRAPQDGIVTRVHQLQVGSYVTASRPLFVLSGTKFWVVANFKENQLRFMRVGQPATVQIDAFPDYKIKAHVASFSPGTGNNFSLLPAENASGNWVKVVQRLPVEIALDALPPGVPLHSGLSVSASVDTGHTRSLFGKGTSPSTQATTVVPSTRAQSTQQP